MSFTFSNDRRLSKNWNKNSEQGLCNEEVIKQLSTYPQNFDFIDYRHNFIQWFDPKDAASFFDKLQQASSRKVTVLHIGDSHIQADISTAQLRTNLQKVFGEGGRGFIFPYAAAGTHAANNYRSNKKGTWTYSRNVSREHTLDIGFSGATVHTKDSNAGFSFKFLQNTVKSNFRKLKIYCRKDSASFDLKINYAEGKEPIIVSFLPDGKSYTEVILPEINEEISFEVEKSNKSQKFLECYGIGVETVENTGVLYHSVGINGAGLRSVIRQKLFGSQLTDLAPDLVVIDLAGNDFYPRELRYEEMLENYNRIITSIRTSAPNASIMIANGQDCYYRSKNVTAFADLANLARDVAKANHCLYYDFFNISGGSQSMLKWYGLGLANNDKIHLSYSGYQVKGELLFNAYMNSYRHYLATNFINSMTNENVDSLEFVPKFVDTTLVCTKSIKINKQQKISPIKGGKIDYIVRSGDNLSKIAFAHNVSITQIMDWNGMNSTKLSVGKKLALYGKSSQEEMSVAPPKPLASTKKATTKTSVSSNKTYTVKNGDSLWLIAKRNGVSVADIKKFNKLTSDKLSLGQVLKLKN